MSKKNFCIALFLYFSFVLVGCGNKEVSKKEENKDPSTVEKKQYEIIVPDTAKLGDFITVRFKAQKKITKATVMFIDNTEKKIQTLEAFPITDKHTEWVAVAGIATWWKPNLWKIKTTLQTEDDMSFEDEKAFKIQDTEFEELVMHLNKRNTNIIYKKSKKKTEQKEKLSELITTINRDTKLCTSPFILPFEITRTSAGFAQKRISKYSNGKTTVRRHWGVDYPAPTGTVIKAPCEGKVVLAENRVVSGNTIVLEHLPGVYTLYYHLNAIYVDEGVFLTQGTTMGEIGTTGFSTGPHLHWELRINSIPVDPRHLLKKKFY